MKHLSFALCLGLIGVFLVLSTGDALASGTPAGTKITNYATMNYKDLAGNSFPAFNSNTVEVTVEQVAGVALSPMTGSQAQADSSYVTYPVTVTNTGNGSDRYTFAIVSTQGWTPQLYRDTNGNGVLDAAEISAGTVSQSSTFGADSTYKLIARIWIPSGTADNTQDTLKVTATSQFDGTVTATGKYVTTVSNVVLQLTKAQNPSNPQPGAVITYTINYSNTGSGNATGALVTDSLASYLTFVNGSITASTGSASYNSSTRKITWTPPTPITASGTGQLTFQATVSASAPAGTAISNSATLVYNDGANQRTVTTTPTTAVVATAPGLAVSAPSQTGSKDVGQTVQYAVTLTNTGNAADSVKITQSSGLAFTWIVWVDANNDGIAGNDGDYLIDVNNSGLIPSGGTLNLLVRATIPTATTDASVDTTTFTFQSISNPSTTTTAKAITTVKAPVMSMVKSVTTVGGRNIPGAVLVYTITYHNGGSGSAASIVISDNVPDKTTYVANSVKLNTVAKTDASDADEVIVGSGTIVVNVGNVGPGASGTIEFRTTIN